MRAVITGAASGIGLATARQLSDRGFDLVLVDRNAEGLREAAETLRGPVPRLEIVDLSSMEAVRQLASRLVDETIDVLINNAGVLVESPVETEDGIEVTFAVNTLAPFLLTRLLWPQLAASGEGRVVNVSSLAYRHGKIDWDDLRGIGTFTRYGAYARSKLSILLLTRALARRAADGSVAVNAVHPGIIGTSLGEGGCISLALRLAGPLLKTPEQGAAGLVFLATESDPLGCRGQYLVGKRVRRTTPRGRDEASAEALYEAVEALLEPWGPLPQVEAPPQGSRM